MNIRIIKMAQRRFRIDIMCPVPHSSSIWQSQDSNPHSTNSRDSVLASSHFCSFSTLIPPSLPNPTPPSPFTSVVSTAHLNFLTNFIKYWSHSPPPSPQRSYLIGPEGEPVISVFSVSPGNSNMLSRLRNTAGHQLAKITDFELFSF